jgi:hypothetical protein
MADATQSLLPVEACNPKAAAELLPLVYDELRKLAAARLVAEMSTLAHTSGEFVKTTVLLRPVKLDPQALGSATTYARRYGLLAMVGLATEDDDGQAGTHANGNGRPPEPPDAMLVAKLEDVLRAATTKPQLAEAVALVTDHRGKLTPAGQDRLRHVYGEVLKKFPT